MQHKITAKALDARRAEEWRAIFGSDTVPVISPIAMIGPLPALEGERRYYNLNLQQITVEQRNRLVSHISQKFNVAPAQVEDSLDKTGFAIVAEDILITGDQPFWLSLEDGNGNESDDD